MRKALLFLLSTTFLLGCTRTEEEDATLKSFQDNKPVKEAFNVRFVFSEDATVQAELQADHAIEAKEGGQDVRIFDRKLHLVFYDKEGNMSSDLTADHGVFKNQFNDAKLWGNVKMLNYKQDQLAADTLFWNKTVNRIRAKPEIVYPDSGNRPPFVRRPVAILTATENILGDSLNANTDFTEYKIYNIRGAVNVKEEGL